MKDDVRKMKCEILALKLSYQYKEQFYKAPFNITIKLNHIKQLDKAFTSQYNIYIYDSRIRQSNLLYKNMSSIELNNYRTIINIKRESRRCLTVRDILNAMIQNEHYNNEYVKQDKHNNLMTLIDITDDLKYFIAIFE